MTAYERAGEVVERLMRLGLIDEKHLLGARYVITEGITDALIEQVDYARAQAPVVHVHTNVTAEQPRSSDGGDAAGWPDVIGDRDRG